MNSEELIKLYTKNPNEIITPFNEEVGFSLIRPYEVGMQYHEKGMKMFIKVAVLDQGLFYSVDMTKPKDLGDGEDYVLVTGKEHGKEITNFTSNTGDGEFTFDKESGKIIHNATNRRLTLNEFIDTLEYNHISDRLKWKRRINLLINSILLFIFWINNKHYNKVQISIDKYHFRKGDKVFDPEERGLDPFFRYFYISKNILLLLFLITFPLAFFFGSLWQSGDFSVSNPTIVLLFFLILFSCEKLSIWIEKKIHEFLRQPGRKDESDKANFIERLHRYQLRNTFDLKLKRYPEN